MWLDRAVDVEQALRLTNRNMIAFDLALGTAALLAPGATLAVLGHDEPAPDAEHLFRRCGPIWLTFAAAHAVADRRGEPRDWWALAWLRGTEIATDASGRARPAFSRPGARAGCGSPAPPTWRWRSASAGSPRREAGGGNGGDGGGFGAARSLRLYPPAVPLGPRCTR